MCYQTWQETHYYGAQIGLAHGGELMTGLRIFSSDGPQKVVNLSVRQFETVQEGSRRLLRVTEGKRRSLKVS